MLVKSQPESPNGRSPKKSRTSNFSPKPGMKAELASPSRKSMYQRELKRRIKEIEVEGRGKVNVFEFPDGTYREVDKNGRTTNIIVVQKTSNSQETVGDSQEPEDLLPVTFSHPDSSQVQSTYTESFDMGALADDEQETQIEFPDTFNNRPNNLSQYSESTSGAHIEDVLQEFQQWGHRITTFITSLQEKVKSAETSQHQAEARAQTADDLRIEAETRQLAAEKKLAEVQSGSAQLTQKLTRIVTDFTSAQTST